jgi:predicted exporter
MARARAVADHRALRVGIPCALLALGLCTLGLRTRDEAGALIRTSPALAAQEARIRALTGLSSGGTFFLVEGRDEGEVLAREEALRDRLAGDRDLDGLQGVSAFVPSPGRQAEALRARREEAPALAAALKDLGFRPEALHALGADLEASAGRPLTVAAWLAAPFSTPCRMLWLGTTPAGQASILLPMGAPDGARMRRAAAGLPGVRYVDKAASVGALLGRYRRLALAALGLACLAVWGALAFRYGPAGAFWVTLPGIFGIGAALAGLALAGLPLTLFGVLGLILILGFAVDYTVFLREGEPASLLGVLLAGGCTLVSYGLLAFSRTPILRGFGLVVALGVLGSLLTSCLALRRRP